MSVKVKIDNSNSPTIRTIKVGIQGSNGVEIKTIRQGFVGTASGNKLFYASEQAEFNYAFSMFSSSTGSILLYFTDNSKYQNATIKLVSGSDEKVMSLVEKGSFTYGTKTYNSKVKISDLSYDLVEITYVDKNTDETVTRTLNFPKIKVRYFSSAQQQGGTPLYSYDIFNGQTIVNYSVAPPSIPYGYKFSGWAAAYNGHLFDSTESNKVVTGDTDSSITRTYTARKQVVNNENIWVLDFYPVLEANYWTVTLQLYNGTLSVGGTEVTGEVKLRIDKTNNYFYNARLESDTTKQLGDYNGNSYQVSAPSNYYLSGIFYTFRQYISAIDNSTITAQTLITQNMTIVANYSPKRAIDQALPPDSFSFTAASLIDYTLNSNINIRLTLNWNYQAIEGLNMNFKIGLKPQNDDDYVTHTLTPSRKSYLIEDLTSGRFKEIQVIVSDDYSHTYTKVFKLYWLKFSYNDVHRTTGISKNHTLFGLGITDSNNGSETVVQQFLPMDDLVQTKTNSSFSSNQNEIDSNWILKCAYNGQLNDNYDNHYSYDSLNTFKTYTEKIVTYLNSNLKPYQLDETYQNGEIFDVYYRFTIKRYWKYKTTTVKFQIASKYSVSINTSSEYYSGWAELSNGKLYTFNNVPFGTQLSTLLTSSYVGVPSNEVFTGWQKGSYDTYDLANLSVGQADIDNGTMTLNPASRYKIVKVVFWPAENGGNYSLSDVWFSNSNYTELDANYGTYHRYEFTTVPLSEYNTIENYLPSSYTEPTGMEVDGWVRDGNRSISPTQKMSVFGTAYNDGDIMSIRPSFKIKTFKVTVSMPDGTTKSCYANYNDTIGTVMTNNQIQDTYTSSKYIFYEWKVLVRVPYAGLVWRSLDKDITIREDTSLKADVFRQPRISYLWVQSDGKHVDIEIDCEGADVVEMWKFSSSGQMNAKVIVKTDRDENTVTCAFDNLSNMQQGIMCLAYRKDEQRVYTSDENGAIISNRTIYVRSSNLYGSSFTIGSPNQPVSGQTIGTGLYTAYDYMGNQSIAKGLNVSFTGGKIQWDVQYGGIASFPLAGNCIPLMVST